MQDKFEIFDELPVELEIAQNLSTLDLVNLAQTSKYHLSLFKPMVDVRESHQQVGRSYSRVYGKEILDKKKIKNSER